MEEDGRMDGGEDRAAAIRWENYRGEIGGRGGFCVYSLSVWRFSLSTLISFFSFACLF